MQGGASPLDIVGRWRRAKQLHEVVEIDRPARPARRNGAKSDELDALRAAREALSREHLAQPRRRGDREAIRVLVCTREGAILSRTRAITHLHALVVNAPEGIRNQLRKLQEWKLAARTGSRPTASKPSALYSITLDGEIQFSTIYLPVLSQFLRVAEGQCSVRQLGSWMRETGRTLGKRYPRPDGTKRQRLEAAAQLLRSFGGLPQVGRLNGSMAIRSRACPLAALTSEHAAACKILEGLLAEYLETRVRSCCVTGSDPSCCFEVKA